MKKLLTIALALVLVLACLFGLTACDDNYDFTVGICQLTQHPALDQATQGFMDALQAKAKEVGKTVKFDLQNASGDQNACSTICYTFVNKNVDLIMANATPALLAAKNAAGGAKKIPVLGTSVTDYPSALGADPLGTNVSGTSDLAPLDKQAEMVKEIFPSATKVALVFCSGEPNSRVQIDQIKPHFATLELQTQEFSFVSSEDIQTVLASACAWADVIYIPTDNTAASNAELIGNICRTNRKPIIAGEEGLCSGCGVATLTIDYYQLGVKTGEMAAEILLNGGDISKMSVQTIAPTYKYNKEMCQALGILDSIPDSYVEIVTE